MCLEKEVRTLWCVFGKKSLFLGKCVDTRSEQAGFRR